MAERMAERMRICLKSNSATEPALMLVFRGSFTLSLLLEAWQKGGGYVGELETHSPPLQKDADANQSLGKKKYAAG